MKDLAKRLMAIIALCCVMASAQLPEDDEVLAGFPDYHHPIYSGITSVS